MVVDIVARHRDGAAGQFQLADHGRASSIYFCDPFGHRLELTTYDHEAARARLNR